MGFNLFGASSESQSTSQTTSTPTSQTATAGDAGSNLVFNMQSANALESINLAGLDGNEKALMLAMIEENYGMAKGIIQSSQELMTSKNLISETTAGVSALDKNFKTGLIVGAIALIATAWLKRKG